MTTRPTFVVHLVPTPDCVDPIKALRFFLKRALRSYGLRCVTLSEATDKDSTEQLTNRPPDGRSFYI
jgi:hypothetical protein